MYSIVFCYQNASVFDTKIAFDQASFAHDRRLTNQIIVLNILKQDDFTSVSHM